MDFMRDADHKFGQIRTVVSSKARTQRRFHARTVVSKNAQPNTFSFDCVRYGHELSLLRFRTSSVISELQHLLSTYAVQSDAEHSCIVR